MRLRFVALPSTDQSTGYVLVLDKVDTDEKDKIAAQAVTVARALRGCAGAIVIADEVEVD